MRALKAEPRRFELQSYPGSLHHAPSALTLLYRTRLTLCYLFRADRRSYMLAAHSWVVRYAP